MVSIGLYDKFNDHTLTVWYIIYPDQVRKFYNFFKDLPMLYRNLLIKPTRDGKKISFRVVTDTNTYNNHYEIFGDMKQKAKYSKISFKVVSTYIDETDTYIIHTSKNFIPVEPVYNYRNKLYISYVAGCLSVSYNVSKDTIDVYKETASVGKPYVISKQFEIYKDYIDIFSKAKYDMKKLQRLKKLIKQVGIRVCSKEWIKILKNSKV